jgi:hypothetical protein
LAVFDAVFAEPVDDVEATDAVVAVDDEWGGVGLFVEFLEPGRDRAHGDEVGAFDAADLPFHVFADVDEANVLTGFAAVFDFADGEFVGEFLIGHGSFHCRGLGKGLE